MWQIDYLYQQRELNLRWQRQKNLQKNLLLTNRSLCHRKPRDQPSHDQNDDRHEIHDCGNEMLE